jgi:hypothetical protein
MRSGEIEADEMVQVIEVLNDGLSKHAPALGLGMRTATKGRDYSVGQWCEILVEKATLRMNATDEFSDLEKEKPTGKLMSDADRLRLNSLEKENEKLKKEITQLKATKQGNKSTSATSATSAAAVGNNGCFKCKKEGYRADRCPENKPATPAAPRQAGAKSAGQSNKKVDFTKLQVDFKVDFTKLQLDTAVQEAAKTAVQETVTAMAKNGWRHP